MKEHRVVKPKVFFEEFDGYRSIGVEGKRAAILKGVLNHPEVGTQYRISTSVVLEVDNEENPSVVHTLNTIFVRKEKDDDSSECCADQPDQESAAVGIVDSGQQA